MQLVITIQCVIIVCLKKIFSQTIIAIFSYYLYKSWVDSWKICGNLCKKISITKIQLFCISFEKSRGNSFQNECFFNRLMPPSVFQISQPNSKLKVSVILCCLRFRSDSLDYLDSNKWHRQNGCINFARENISERPRRGDIHHRKLGDDHAQESHPQLEVLHTGGVR